MTKIVHATDFSENAALALRYAYQLAQKMKGQLYLIHIANLTTLLNSPDLPSFSEMEQARKEALTDQLKNYWTSNLNLDHVEIPVEFKIEFSNSRANSVIDFASMLEAELIVAGMKGQSRMKEFILGSTSRALIENATCPVLLVPEETPVQPIKKIVYASDFDEHDQASLENLKSMAKALNANISLLHIAGKDEDKAHFSETALEKYLQNNALPLKTIVTDHVVDGISDYIDSTDTDLLVILARKHGSFVNNLFHKDHIKQFSKQIAVPVLCYNELLNNN